MIARAASHDADRQSSAASASSRVRRCVRRIDGRLRERVVERPHDALAHLARGLARERHRDDLLRALDPRQQREDSAGSGARSFPIRRAPGPETSGRRRARAPAPARPAATNAARDGRASGIAVLAVGIACQRADPAQRLQAASPAGLDHVARGDRGVAFAHLRRHRFERSAPARLRPPRQSASPGAAARQGSDSSRPGSAVGRQADGLHFARAQLRIGERTYRPRDVEFLLRRASRGRAAAPRARSSNQRGRRRDSPSCSR